MSKVRINIPPAGGAGGKKKAAGESDLAKGDVILGKRIDRGRDTFGEDQPGFGDSDSRPEDLDGNPHLAAAVAFLEGLLDPNKPFDKNAMAKVIYYLHHYYHVNYVSRLCMEIILKVLQWPYVSRFVMQRLTTHLDIHMLTETFPKLIRIHSSSNPKMLGYTIAVMGCVADLDARHFSGLGGHGQLYFHVIQAAQKMYKSDAVMLNTLLFLQRLCAPSSVDFFLTRTQKAALVKLGGNRVGMPLSADSGLGKTVSVPPELDVTARGEMTAHDRKVQMLSSTGYADEMLAQYLVSTQTAGDIFLGKVQYYSYTKNEHDYDARCVTTLHQTQRYPSEKLVGKQLGAKYKVSRMPRANMKSMMPGGRLPTDVTPSGSVTPVSSNGGGAGLYLEGEEGEDGFHTPPRKSPPPRNKKLPPVEQGSAGGKGGKNSKTPGGKKENKSPGVGGKKETPQGKTPGTTAAGAKNGKTPGKKQGAAASPLGHNVNDHDPLPEDAPLRTDGVVGLDTDEAVPSELAQIQDDRERKRWLDKQQTLEYCDFYTRIRDCHLKNQVELFSSGALEWLLQLLQQLAVPPIYHRAPKSLKTKEEEAEDKQRLAEKKAREEAERKAAEEEERQRKEEEEANAKRAEEALAAATAAANANRDREKMGSGEKAKTGSRGGSGAAGGSAGRKTRSRSPGADRSGGSAGRNKSPAAAEGFIENGIDTTTGLPVVVQAGGAEGGDPHLTEGAPGQAEAQAEPEGKPSSRPASAANKSRPSSRTQSASRKNSTMEDAAAGGVGAAPVGEAGQVLKVDDVVLDDARRSSVNSTATAPAAMENAAPSAAAGSRPQSRSGTPQKTRTPELQRRASAPATLEEQAKTPPRSGGGSRPGTPGTPGGGRGSTVASKPEIGLMPLDEEGHEVAAAAPPAGELEQSQAGVEHQERPGSGKNPTTYARAATTPIPGAERPEHQGTLSLDAISAQVAASGVEPPFAGPNVTEPASTQAQQVPHQPTLLQESGAPHLGDLQPSIPPPGDQHPSLDLPDKPTRSAAPPARKQAKPKKQSKKELAAQAELRRLEAERKKQEELRQIRLSEMEKEGREADVLLLGLHSLYLLVRENPHTLRRLCRSEIWEHISDGQKDHSGTSKKDHHSLEDQNVVPVGLGGPGTSGPDGVSLKPPGDNSSLPTGATGTKKKKKNRGDHAADTNEDDDWRKLPPAELFERAKRKKLSQITQIDEIQKSCILTFSKLLKGRYAQDRADIILLLFRVIKLCALYWSKDPEVGPWLELVGPVQEALGWFSDNMFVQIEGAQALSGILKMSRVNSGGPAKEGATKLEGVSKHKGPAPADGGGEPAAGAGEKDKDKENTSKPKEEANPRNEKEFLGLRVPVLRNLSERIKDGIVNTKTILEVQERMGAGEMAEVLQCFSPRLLELAQKAKDACDEMMIEALQEKKKLDEKLAIALEKAEAKRLKEEEERLAAEAEKEKERAEKEAEATKKKKAEEGEAAGENAAAAGEGGEQPPTEKKEGEQPQADGTAAANSDAAAAADAGGAAPDGAEKKETDAATEKNPADQENGENNLPENGEQENKEEEEENNEEQPPEDFGVDLEGNPVTEHLDPVTQAKIALRAASEFQGKLGDPSLVGNTQIQLFEPSILKSVKPITETAGTDPIVRPRKVTRKGMKFRLYYRAGADENVASMLKMFEGDANRLRCQKLYASAVNGLGYELPTQGLTLGLRCVQFQPDQENLDAISGSDAVFSEEEGRGALKRAKNYETMMAQMEARLEAGERRAMLAKLSGAVDVETGDMDLLDAQAEQGQLERDRLNSAEGRGLKRVTKGGGNYLPVMAPSGSGSGFFE